MKTSAKNAIMIGTLCATAYLAVYIARNILSAVTPQIIEQGIFDEAFIGKMSSIYFICYAVGQLINGMIGDKIKARWMISLGLLFAGTTNFVFQFITATPTVAMIVYGVTGFFLAMIYAPMTKVVSENTEPLYATRCSLGYTVASFLGSPFAGLLAAGFAWQTAFMTSSAVLWVMAIVVFVCFLSFEKKGFVKYNQFNNVQSKGNGKLKILLKHRIIKFALISFITGIVRTTVVFWLPTYFNQYLGYSASVSATVFTVATLIIAANAFIAVFIYEKLKYNIDATILIMFLCATAFFLLTFIIYVPLLNIIFIVLAVMSSNGAASMLWSVYCPSLKSTGFVSSATGFLDFVSYMAAALSTLIFGEAVSVIGWDSLVLIWAGLMLIGVIVSLPFNRILKKSRSPRNILVDCENEEDNLQEKSE